jgi:hypothetical protein
MKVIECAARSYLSEVGLRECKAVKVSSSPSLQCNAKKARSTAPPAGRSEEISKPLTDLFQKKSFCWNELAEAAFNRLKEAVTTAPV